MSEIHDRPASTTGQLPDYGCHPGLGDWQVFTPEALATLRDGAKLWEAALRGVDKPWLCWHINRRWCLLQQRIILDFGWTPVVGGDPRFGEPALLPGSIALDFNKPFHYPIMFPLFPLEFVFLFADKFAFMHSDLICRPQVMEKVVRVFDDLADGDIVAPYLIPGRRHLLNRRLHRYWDLMTCTTRKASENQFQLGAGWWKNFAYHPNCPDERARKERLTYYYDFGTGIAYWERKLKGRVTRIPLAPLQEGHCTSIGKKGYKFLGTVRNRNVEKELDLNYSLDLTAEKLGLKASLAEVDEFLRDLPSDPEG